MTNDDNNDNELFKQLIVVAFGLVSRLIYDGIKAFLSRGQKKTDPEEEDDDPLDL